MASEWFCKISGAQVGPLTSQQLKTFAVQGRLRREDQVRQGADNPWVAAGKVKGLFGDRTPAQPGGKSPKSASVRPPPVVRAPATLAGLPPGVGDNDETMPGIVIVGLRNIPVDDAAAEPRRRHKSKARVYLVSLGGTILVVGGLVALINWMPKQPLAKLAAEASTAGAETDAKESPGDEGQKAATPDLDDLDVTRRKKPGGASDSAAAAPAAAGKAASAASKTTQWHDVTKGSLPYKSGDIDVSLKIDPVQLGRASMQVVDRKTGKLVEKFLFVTVTVENLSQTKQLELKPFSRQLLQKALVDESDNSYRPVPLGSPQAIEPGKNGSDKVVFESPSASAKTLRLTLPAEAFGGRGPLKFEIPTSIITQAPEPTQERVGQPPVPQKDQGMVLPGNVLRKSGDDPPPINLTDMFDAKPKADAPKKPDEPKKTEEPKKAEEAKPDEPKKMDEPENPFEPKKPGRTKKANTKEK